jgi:hypothetical protein
MRLNCNFLCPLLFISNGGYYFSFVKLQNKGFLMRYISVIFLVLMGVFSQGHADDSQNALDAANKLVSLVSNSIMKQMVDQNSAAFLTLMNMMDEEDQFDEGTVSELRAEFERIQTKYISLAMESAPSIYAKYFSAYELNELIAFYNTSIGAKELEVMPQITGECMALLFPSLPQLSAEMDESLTKILQKNGYDTDN